MDKKSEKKKYEKPKGKKEFFEPEMKKSERLNKVIGTSCGLVYGCGPACFSCDVA